MTQSRYMITESIHFDATQHAEWAPDLAEALAAECDDSAVTESMDAADVTIYEFWGTDHAGQDWRVHLARSLAGREEA